MTVAGAKRAVAIVGVLLALLCGGRAVGQVETEHRLTLQVAPPQISLLPDAGPTIAVIQAAVPAGVVPEDVSLSVPAIDHVHILVEPNPADASGDLLWTLRVSAETGAPADVQIPVVVSWRASPGGVRRRAVASLHAAVLPAVGASVTLRLQPDFQELTEVGKHSITLFVENHAGMPVRLASIGILSAPDFIALAFPTAGGAVVQPGDVLTVAGEARLTGGYSSRTYEAALRVGMTALDGQLRFEKTVATPITVAVPGLGDAMKMVEAPSLILLPGLITLVVAAGLRAKLFAWRPAGPGEGAADWKTPDFWIGAITLSGLIAWAAYRFVGVDLADSYRMGQVIALWALSLSIFPLCYLLWRWLMDLPLGWAARGLQFLLHDRLTVRETDSALAVLRMLWLTRGEIRLDRVRLNEGGRLEELFVLPASDTTGEKLWVVPGIVITGQAYPHQGAARLDQMLDDPAQSRLVLDTVLRGCGETLGVLAMLRGWFEGPPQPQLQVSFEPGSLGRPILRAKDALEAARHQTCGPAQYPATRPNMVDSVPPGDTSTQRPASSSRSFNRPKPSPLGRDQTECNVAVILPCGGGGRQPA